MRITCNLQHLQHPLPPTLPLFLLLPLHSVLPLPLLPILPLSLTLLLLLLESGMRLDHLCIQWLDSHSCELPDPGNVPFLLICRTAGFVNRLIEPFRVSESVASWHPGYEAQQI